MLYRSYARNFCNELLLKEMNNDLALKVIENEEINNELEAVNENLKSLAIMDELTKVSNRRGFHEYLQQSMNSGKRKLSLLMMDIDAFKQFNDYYGHLHGDRALYLVAQTTKDIIEQEKQFVARFGGEEFLVAAFDLDEESAYQLAESIRGAVKNLKLDAEPSPISDYLTLSIGIASGSVVKQKDVEDLMSQADTALYKAKINGRDRVEVLVNER